MPHGINFVHPLRRAGKGLTPVQGKCIKVNGTAQRNTEVELKLETVGKNIENKHLSRIGVGCNATAYILAKPYLVPHFVFNYLAVKQAIVVQTGAVVTVDARFCSCPQAAKVVFAQRKHTVTAKSASGRYGLTVKHFTFYGRQNPA